MYVFESGKGQVLEDLAAQTAGAAITSVRKVPACRCACYRKSLHDPGSHVSDWNKVMRWYSQYLHAVHGIEYNRPVKFLNREGARNRPYPVDILPAGQSCGQRMPLIARGQGGQYHLDFAAMIWVCAASLIPNKVKKTRQRRGMRRKAIGELTQLELDVVPQSWSWNWSRG